MKNTILNLSICCLLLIAAGVSFVSADYWDGYPDWASVHHGDLFWANHGEVTAWYSAPQLYYAEQHSAYSWVVYPNWVTDCVITFTGKYHDEIRYEETWENQGSLSKTENYGYTCTLARTHIYTRYINGITGTRWSDTINVTVRAGVGPG